METGLSGVTASIFHLRAAFFGRAGGNFCFEVATRPKKSGELCGSRLPFGLRIESRIPFVELLSEFFI